MKRRYFQVQSFSTFLPLLAIRFGQLDQFHYEQNALRIAVNKYILVRAQFDNVIILRDYHINVYRLNLHALNLLRQILPNGSSIFVIFCTFLQIC